MLTVGHAIRLMLPNGSQGDAETGACRKAWCDCPSWPPDVFAVAATLADRSGCYAEPGLAISRNDEERRSKIENAERARRAGRLWARSKPFQPPEAAEAAWKQLHDAWDEPVCVGAGQGEAWKRAALSLMAITDEACAFVGFTPEKTSTALQHDVAEQCVLSVAGKADLRLPASLTSLIPAEIACVMPKSLTPEVGCNLRSLSHHLALLPGCGSVRPLWYLSHRPKAESEPERDHALNLLLIPFPYVVRAEDFAVARAPHSDADGGTGVDGYAAGRSS